MTHSLHRLENKIPIKLGVLVPSSNTALEPLTSAIISALAPDVTVRSSRFPGTKISLEPSALAQFDTNGAIMATARLLADAEVDVIGWSGTSGGWLGFDMDERLCKCITEELGVPATTSTLSLNRALDILGAKRVALVTPYLDEVQSRIVQVYSRAGYDVVAESHLGKFKNVEFAQIGEEMLDAQVRAAEWEAELGIPVLDSVSTIIWDMLRITRVQNGRVKGWGKLFEL